MRWLKLEYSFGDQHPAPSLSTYPPLHMELSFILFVLGDDDFMMASQVLLTWLERGEVSRKNITQFYSMIQCTNAHIRRLLSEKQSHEEELLKMKEKFKTIFEGILRQCKYSFQTFISQSLELALISWKFFCLKYL